MKTTLIVAMALVLGGLAPGLAAPAAAQRTVVTERTVREGPAPRRWHTRRVCSTHYRHGHRIRTCRTVRTR